MRIGAARPDVVIMDWQMPGINGVEATMRLLAEHPHLRVVGYASSGEPTTRQAFFAAGAVEVFAKEQALVLRDWLGAMVADRDDGLQFPRGTLDRLGPTTAARAQRGA